MCAGSNSPRTRMREALRADARSLKALSTTRIHDIARWALLIAVALVASALGHVLTFTIGPSSALAEVRPYAHVAQGPLLDIAVILLAVGIFIIADNALRFYGRSRREPDWLLPALSGIARRGLTITVVTVAALQFAAFTIGELAEQSAAGAAVTGSIFGAHPLIAVAALLIVGVFSAFVLWASARWTCVHAGSFATLAEALISWLKPSRSRCTAAVIRSRIIRTVVATVSILALRIANRPPPAPSIP